MRGNKNVEKHACQNAVAMESSNCFEKVINIQSQGEHFLPQLATLTRVASHWFGSDRVNFISISLLNANLFRTLMSDLAPFFLPQPLNRYRSVTSYCKWATGDPELSNGWSPNMMLDCEQSLYISRVQRDPKTWARGAILRALGLLARSSLAELVLILSLTRVLSLPGALTEKGLLSV